MVSQWRSRLPQRKKRGVSLLFMLVVPFILQIAVVVGLTGYLSLQNGQQAVKSLLTQLTQEVSDRVIQHLDSFATTSRRLATTNSQHIQMGIVQPSDTRSLSQFFWHQIQTYQVGYLLYGDQLGRFVGAGYFFNDGSVSINETNPDQYHTKHLYTYNTDTNGKPQKLAQVDQNYTFESEDWYANTLKVKQPNWSSIYNWQNPPFALAIAASVPVLNDQNRPIASVAVESRLSQLSHFLGSVNISRAGRIFILERSGLLVASSDRSQPFTVMNQKPQRLSGENSQDALTQAAARYLKARFGALQMIQTPQQLQFQHQGETHFLKVVPWRDRWGLDWLIAIVVPESEFMGQIRANTRSTINLCLIALAVALILGVYTSRWIARPIQQLGKASQAIAHGNFEQQVPVSFINELKVLAVSFNKMMAQLQASFLNLEHVNAELEARVQARTAELQTTLHTLNQTQAQMIQSEKMSALGQMVAGIAHEINNPVSFIYGNLTFAQEYTQLLSQAVQLYQMHYPNPTIELQTELEAIDLAFVQADLPKILSSMRIGAERISQIVLSLRNFSRKDEAEYKAVDLHQGIDSTLMILHHRLKEQPNRSAIDVIKQYGDLPLVECYAGQLNQVLMNLLVNAIDALEDGDTTSVGSSQIRIETAVVDLQWAQITIVDNGRGIPASIQAQIFDPFFTTKPIGKGTGMGLAISYQIITEKHGGQLTCCSTPGVGTKFVIKIPICQSKQPE